MLRRWTGLDDISFSLDQLREGMFMTTKPTAALARELGWEQQEAGWWTHPKHGGICLERDKAWWCHPGEGLKHGPYPTLRAAIEAAEREV